MARRRDSSAQYFVVDPTIDLTAAASVGSTHSLRLSLDPAGTATETHGIGRTFSPVDSTVVTFNPSTDVAANTITKAAHGYATGDRLIYDSGSTADAVQTPIKELFNGQIVHVISTGANTFQLAATGADAAAGKAITLTTNSATGAGASGSDERRLIIGQPLIWATTTDSRMATSLSTTMVTGASIEGLAHGTVFYGNRGCQ